MNKKRLVLHHDVRSTDFLKPIYAQLSSKTVVHHSVDVDVRALIHSHERVIMLCHGYSGSLFYMVDNSHASLLRQKKDLRQAILETQSGLKPQPTYFNAITEK